MAYRCEACGVAQPDRTSCNIVPEAYRTKTYSFYDEKQKRQRTTSGMEIIQELKLCHSCLNKLEHGIT